MLTFKWSDTYNTGVKSVDEQHSKLVDMVNNLGEMIQADKISNEKLDEFFVEIAKYAQQHFKDEEDYMDRLSIDPRHTDVHKKAHANFLNEAAKIYNGIKHQHVGPELLFHFLSNWLVIHILGTDKVLAKQIFAVQNGVSPQQAYESEKKNTDSTIGPLLYAVNQLFSRTIAMNHKLLELNASLENQIKSRTSDLQSINNSLRAMALTDTLTKLANRRAAVAYLKNEWKKPMSGGATITCIMIDVDKFKHINDSQGHEAGDKVLSVVAKTIKDSVRTDDFVCRLGGDEFVVLSNNSNLDSIIQLAEHIRAKINQIIIKFPSDTWLGSISVGVAARDDNMTSYIDLIKKADEGLYIAKKNGRNQVGCSQMGV